MVELRMRYRGTPRSVREAREAVIDYARLCGFPSQLTIDIALGVGEALANAVEHGNKDLGFISVTCSFADGVLSIEVCDEGGGFDVGNVSKRHRQPDAVRGFGMSIMHAVMDSVEYKERGTCVRLRKQLRHESADSTSTSAQKRGA
jgi:anti-sigma regulatory factor (Ser/Thr protein kinase)